MYFLPTWSKDYPIFFLGGISIAISSWVRISGMLIAYGFGDLLSSFRGGRWMEATIIKRMIEESKQEPKPSYVVKDFSPYDPVSSLSLIYSLPPEITPLKLDWNESSIPPSPKVLKAIQDALNNGLHLNWYPELSAPRLREAISKYTGIDRENILVTNGSDDALDLICRTYIDPMDDCLTIWPTYGHFVVFAKARGAKIRQTNPIDPFDVQTDYIQQTIRKDTKMVYIASPNNPTGVVTPPKDIELLCSSWPSTLFVVDEAYFEFSGITSVPLVKSYKNLVITRTFSKCFGIAGLRVGYLITQRPVLDNIKKIYNPKSVNTIAQIGAEAALSDPEYKDMYVSEVRKSKDYLCGWFRSKGMIVKNTEANFVLLKLKSPKKFVERLEKIGIFVRDRSHIKGFEGYIRITVGTVAQMKDLTSRIEKLMIEEPYLFEKP